MSLFPKLKRPRLTLGTQLAGLMAVLLLATVASLVHFGSELVTEDNTALIQQMNSDAASGLAARTRELLAGVTEKCRILATALLRGSGETVDPAARERLAAELFASDKELLALSVIRRGTPADGEGETALIEVTSPELRDSYAGDAGKFFASMRESRASDPGGLGLAAVSRGESQLDLRALADGTSAVSLALPLIEDAPGSGRFSHVLLAWFKQPRLARPFQEMDAASGFLIDSRGRAIVSPDAANAAATVSMTEHPMTKALLARQGDNGQSAYADPATGERKLGAFAKVGFAGLGVVVEVSEAKALEAARRFSRRAVYLGIGVLCISLFAGYFFSETIARRVRRLAEAARRISQGDFAYRLPTASAGDEVTELSQTFNEMAAGLEERDRVKATFAKFHSAELADRILASAGQGELKLGGERVEAVVLFSDVRGFTSMSESMPPEEVVAILNRYLTRMVAVILDEGGVVDKFVGDAIMALWGVPFAKPDDCARAVRACLRMRSELAVLNAELETEGKPPLKFGVGLNFGPVIAGNIGSDQRMEYTVIGDTVNTASRIEGKTKDLGTDVLISSSVLAHVQHAFKTTPMGDIALKGKQESIALYYVVGERDASAPLDLAIPEAAAVVTPPPFTRRFAA